MQQFFLVTCQLGDDVGMRQAQGLLSKEPPFLLEQGGFWAASYGHNKDVSMISGLIRVNCKESGEIRDLKVGVTKKS